MTREQIADDCIVESPSAGTHIGRPAIETVYVMGLLPTGTPFKFPAIFSFTGMLAQIGVLKVKPGGDGAPLRKDS